LRPPGSPFWNQDKPLQRNGTARVYLSGRGFPRSVRLYDKLLEFFEMLCLANA